MTQTVSCQPDCTCVDPDGSPCTGNLNGMILTDATEINFLVNENASENTIEWEIYPEVELTITDSVYATIAANILEEGTFYRLICKKTPNTITTGHKYTRSIDFYVSENPSVGEIKCSPSSLTGFGEETIFWLSLTGFIDGENTDFLYSYSYERVGDELENELIILSDSALLKTELPHGNVEHNYQIKIIGRVYNMYGAMVEVYLIITVNPPSVINETDFIEQQLSPARSEGTESILVVRFCIFCFFIWIIIGSFNL